MDPEEYERVFHHELSHFWYRGLHTLVRRALTRHAGHAPPLDILDAGCGTGGLMSQLATLGRVTGVDASAHALALAARRAQRRLVRGEVEALPFPAARFDAIVSADVLYHRGVRDDQRALAELARVCRPGGIVILNLPAHAWLRGDHDVVIHTARRYARRDLQRLAAGARLEPVRVSHFNCALFPLAVVVRLAARGAEPHSDVRALPAGLNRVLAGLLDLEGRLALRLPLPWGLSLFAVLRKPE